MTARARIPTNNSLELNSWVGGQYVDHSFSEVAKVTGTECLGSRKTPEDQLGP